MSTLGGTALTLLDLAKSMDPDGKMARIVEILTQTNEMLEDMTFIPCNDGTAHQTTIRTGLPAGTWRQYNQGVQPEKGTLAQVKATTGMLHSNSVIDADLARRGGDVNGARANEAVAHIAGLSQTMATAIIYADERVTPSQITGLQAHYSTMVAATAASAQNVIDGGGSGSDNSSIYIVGWGPNTITGLVPQGSKVGLTHEDDGEVDIIDGLAITGASYRAYRERFKFHTGICVRDWRYGVRICNIDMSNLVAQSSAADLVNLLIRGLEHMQDLTMGRCAIYMNRTVREFLRIMINTGSKYMLTYDNIAGKRVMAFDGVPVRRCDALLSTEATVV